MTGIDTAAIREAAVTEVTETETVFALCDEVDQLRLDADALTREFRARVAELEAENERLRSDNHHLLHPSQGETVTMQSRLDTMARALDEVGAERDALRAAVNRVRARAESEIADAKVAQEYAGEINHSIMLAAEQTRERAWRLALAALDAAPDGVFVAKYGSPIPGPRDSGDASHEDTDTTEDQG